MLSKISSFVDCIVFSASAFVRITLLLYQAGITCLMLPFNPFQNNYSMLCVCFENVFSFNMTNFSSRTNKRIRSLTFKFPYDIVVPIK